MPYDSKNPDPDKKSNLASRALVALGFGSVGAKLGTFGTLADVNELFAGKNMGFGQKLSSVFDGTFTKALREKLTQLIVHEKKPISHALAKTAKYSIITTAVGVIAGVAIGWTRGGLIDDWKDIIKHPIRSTKIIFGFDAEKSAKDKSAEPPSKAAADVTKSDTPKSDRKWAAYHDARERAAHESKNPLAGPTSL